MKRQTLITIGKYALGLAALAYVIWRNWSAPAGSQGVGIADALQRPLQVVPLLLASTICCASILLTFVRWYVLVRAQDLPFTLSNAMRLGLIGYFLSTFLPGSVGGDIFKAAYLAREQSRRTVAVATVMIDRALGLWALFGLVALLGGSFWLAGNPSLLEQRSLQWIVLVSVALVGTTLLFWFLLGVLPQRRANRFAGRLENLPKIGHAAAEFWRAVWMYRCRGRSMALALVLALVGHVGFVLSFYFAAQTFLPPDQATEIPTMEQHFVIVPIGMTWQAFFPSPGGVGGGEYGYGTLYRILDKPATNGVLGSLVGRLITWGLSLLGYLVYLRMRPTMPIEQQTWIRKESLAGAPS